MRGLIAGIYSATNIPSYPLYSPKFDGTYYLENTSPTGLPSGNASKSIFGWINVTQPVDTQVLFGYGTNSDNYHQTEFVYNDSYRELTFWWNQPFSTIDYYGHNINLLSPDTWYFIGMTFDGNNNFINLHIYVNGMSSHLSVGTGGIDSATDRIRIGLGMNHFSAFANLFVGNVEKVGVWNRALSINEINAYYAAGRVPYNELPSNLTTTTNTETANSQARLLNLGNFQARKVEIDDLQATASSFYRAARFNGGSKIVITNAPTNVVTISVWTKYDAVNSNGPIIVKGSNAWSSGQWDWGIWADNNNFYAVVEPSGSFCTLNHNNTSWYHIVLVRDNGSGNGFIYLNGNLAASTTSGNTNSQENTIYIGGVDSSEYIPGAIEEIQLFDHALSPSDVTNLYNSGLGTYGSVGDSGLLAGYHLNNDLTDYSQNANNGSWNGTPAFVTGGIINAGYKAANFDGSSQITTTSAPVDVNTISVWVNSDSGSNCGAIITKGNSTWDSNQWDWGIWHDGGSTFYAAGPIGLIASHYYSYNTWYHLVVVQNDGNGASKFYVNGTLVGSGTAATANNYANNIYIGGTGNLFVGKIEEIQLFNRGLSPSEVTDLYNNGNGVYGSSLDSGLVGGYHLNGDTTDYSSNALNGTWSGTTQYTTGIISSNVSSTDNINTSGGYTLQALTQISIDDVNTSSGKTLQFASPIMANIVTSSGAYLQFGKSTTVNNGVVSFWNLSESSGTRYDSFGTNHLNQVNAVTSFNYTTPVGRGLSTTFTNTTTLTTTSWYWDFGDGTSSTEQNPTHTYNYDGTFTVTLTVDGISSISHDIVVEEPVPSFTDNSPVYRGLTMTFTDTSNHAISWFWDFGDGNTSTEQNPTHTYAAAGTYTVTLAING